MSYAIGYVIYGVLFNDECRNIFEQTEESQETWDELENHGEYGGFELPYCGGGPGWGYCGVLLDRIDECSVVELDKKTWTATTEQKKEALDKVANLYPPFRDKIGVVGHYIVWGSS